MSQELLGVFTDRIADLVQTLCLYLKRQKHKILSHTILACCPIAAKPTLLKPRLPQKQRISPGQQTRLLASRSLAYLTHIGRHVQVSDSAMVQELLSRLRSVQVSLERVVKLVQVNYVCVGQ